MPLLKLTSLHNTMKSPFAVCILFTLVICATSAPISENRIVIMARTDLEEAKAAESETKSAELRASIFEKMATLSLSQRLDYVTELTRIIAKEVRPSEQELTAHAAFGLMQASGTNSAEKAQAISRLLVSPEVEIRTTAESLLNNLDVVQKSNGERFRDFSVYRLALEEAAGENQSQLILFLFGRLPIEAATWFAENCQLPESERLMLIDEISQARRITDLTGHPWETPGESRFTNLDRDSKLHQWIASPSWILQVLAWSLLEKYPPWQTPELQSEVQNVTVPQYVKLLSLSNSKPPSNDKSQNGADSHEISKSSILTSNQPVQSQNKIWGGGLNIWPWLLGILALIVTGFTLRRAM